MNSDIVLLAIPRMDPTVPAPALALLKPIVTDLGMSCKTFDLNALWHDYCIKNNLTEVWKDIDDFFVANLEIEKEEIPESHNVWNNWITKTINDIISTHNPKKVGVSIFSNNSIRPGKDVLKLCKEANVETFIGGSQLIDSLLNKGDPVDSRFKEYVDHYIIGEGENALQNFLLYGKGPGVDNPHYEQIDNLDSLPFADYSDYDMNLYEESERRWPITGSRGCVRRCSFCNVGAIWKKFRFRSGKHIADEIKYLIDSYPDVTSFDFNDSLINGSMKAFKDMCTTLAEYRSKTPAMEKLSIVGQFIVRSKTQMPPEDFDMMKKAGIRKLIIGVESGSDSVRHHMAKKFTTADMDYTMEQLARVGIKSVLLLIVGYPTETREDFDQTLDMLRRYQKYQKYISRVSLGTGLAILAGTPLADQVEEIGIVNPESETNWYVHDRPDYNYGKRLDWRIEAEELLDELGYRKNSSSELQIRKMKKKWKKIQEKSKNS